MNNWQFLVTSTAIALVASPVLGQTEDELEVTMEVMDTLSDLDRDLNEIRGPRASAEPADQADESAEERDQRLNAEAEVALARQFAGIEDDFEYDDVNNDFETAIDAQDDYERSEEVDTDELVESLP
ncbi:MAG: hypothetical protein RIA65_16225 [Woeseia sp.]